MNRTALSLYHALPPGMRSTVASLRGMHLRMWRYGPETNRWVDEALERDHWSAAQWGRYQEDRLAYVLERAATRVPYYREHWQRRRRNGDRSSAQLLSNWPVLEKSELRAAPRTFLADDRSPRLMFAEHTSGTTGTPLSLWWSRETVRRWFALFEARTRRWYGVTRHDRWAILGGQLVVPPTTSRPPFWVWNAGLNQLYLSSYHIHAQTADAYLTALREHRVRYLLGYPSALAALARAAARDAGRKVGLTVVVANAEPLTAVQRALIGEVFNCPVRDTYGMAEVVAAASECASGTLHLWPEVGWIEPTSATAGELICTGLLNDDMPLIRYRVGDRACVDVLERRCACGRSLPQMTELEGRADDVVYTADGRPIGRLDPVFKAALHIREAQVIQHSFDRVLIRYVPDDGHAPSHVKTMVDGIIARMGPVQVDLEPMAAIPRGANGKFRAVICTLSSEAIRRRTGIEP